MTETNEGVKQDGTKNWLEAIRTDWVQAFAGWVNSLTGQGDPSRDKSAAAYWLDGQLLDWMTLTSLFTFNALARAICTALPEWSMRNGWDLTLDGDAVASQRIESAVRATLDDIGAHAHLLRAATWGQTFGGGLLLLGVEDGRDPKEPVDESRIQRVGWVRVVPRHRAKIVTVFDDPQRERFGEPALFEVRELGANSWKTTQFHASRVILFPGPTTDDEVKHKNLGWDQSILDVVVTALMKHDGMWDDVGAMTKDGSQGVWMIQGLAAAAASGLGEQIQARIRFAETTRSIFGALLLDANKEDFKYVERSYGGISDLLGQSAIRTAGAAQMPATVLMGQSPAGLNATGESDLELWYARCEAYQTGVFVSRFEKLVRYVLLSKEGPTRGVEPETWAVKMRDPRKLSPMQRKEIEARQSQIDGAMIAAKVVTPEEVAVSRYTSEGWSDVTALDLGWRRAFLARMQKQLDGDAAETLFERMLERWMALAPEGVQQGTEPTDPAGGVQEPSGEMAPQDKGDAAPTLVRLDAGSGVMIAWPVPPELAADLALPGGEAPEDLHVTLAYLGKELDHETISRAILAMHEARSAPLEGVIGGLGRFSASSTSEGMDVLVALVDVPGLGLLRARLVEALTAADVPVSVAHDFTPHVTLAYLPSGSPLPVQQVAPRPARIEHLTIYQGTWRHSVRLAGGAL